MALKDGSTDYSAALFARLLIRAPKTPLKQRDDVAAIIRSAIEEVTWLWVVSPRQRHREFAVMTWQELSRPAALASAVRLALLTGLVVYPRYQSCRPCSGIRWPS